MMVVRATIFLAISLIVSITAGNNFLKERQFRKLQKKLDESKVQVMREGSVREVELRELVVGDLVYFNIGEILPVDGLMISGSEVKVDESSLTGESDMIRKLPVREMLAQNSSSLQVAGKTQKQSPFLVSGTKVEDGTGTLLVLAGRLGWAGGTQWVLIRSRAG